MSERNKVNSYREIQGIRAIAILGIFLSHTYIFWGLNNPTLNKICLCLGSYGVYTFFVISGFLCGKKEKFCDTNLRWNDIIRNSWHHVRKLYPLHIITLIVAGIAKYESILEEPIKMVAYLPFQFTLTQSFFPIGSLVNSYNGPAWYLSSFLGVWIIIGIFSKTLYRIREASISTKILIFSCVLILQSCWLLVVKDIIVNALPINASLYYDWLVYK